MFFSFDSLRKYYSNKTLGKKTKKFARIRRFCAKRIFLNNIYSVIERPTKKSIRLKISERGRWNFAKFNKCRTRTEIKFEINGFGHLETSACVNSAFEKIREKRRQLADSWEHKKRAWLCSLKPEKNLKVFQGATDLMKSLRTKLIFKGIFFFGAFLTWGALFHVFYCFLLYPPPPPSPIYSKQENILKLLRNIN